MHDPEWMARHLRIATPENVEFTYELAGLGMRFVAWLIDCGVIMVASIVLMLIGSCLAAGLAGWGQMFLFTSTFVLWQGYFLILEGLWHGQTLGKRLVKIRVIDARGLRITWGQSAVRNIFRLVDALPFFYVVGGIAALVHRQGLRLGDLAAGTVVVKAARTISPVSLVPAAERHDALLKDFALAERVRRLLRTPEKDLLGSLVVRRDRLEESSRMETFAAAADYFEDVLDVRRPEFVSPERFVLNLCAVAYMPRERATELRARR